MNSATLQKPQQQLHETPKQRAEREANDRREQAKKLAEDRKNAALDKFIVDVAERIGFTVKKAGKSYEGYYGKDEYRFFASRDNSDVWLATDKQGGRYWNVINLVMDFAGKTYHDAVSFILGEAEGQPIQFRKVSEVVKHAPALVVLPMPLTTADASRRCMEYCTEVRGISKETMEIAIDQRVIASSLRGPAFLGWDEEFRLRYIETRYIKAFKNSKGKWVSKLSTEGTNKSYVPILMGNCDTVWLVEGGFDLLASADLCRKAKKSLPNVICSGGSRNYFKLLENPKVVSLLKQAKRIIIWHENEEKESVQGITDEDHEKMANHIDEFLGRKMCEFHRPPLQYKDLAVWNEHV